MNIILFLPTAATIAIFALSVYIVYVSCLVTGRMSRRTSNVKRVTVVLSGGLAAWAFEKCVTQTWSYTLGDIILAVTITVVAASLLAAPRIQV